MNKGVFTPFCSYTMENFYVVVFINIIVICLHVLQEVNVCKQTELKNMHLNMSGKMCNKISATKSSKTMEGIRISNLFPCDLLQYKLTNNKMVWYENIFILLWHVKSFYFSLLVHILKHVNKECTYKLACY